MLRGLKRFECNMGKRRAKVAHVAWWKRLFYSLGSVAIAGSVCGAIVVTQQLITNSHTRFDPRIWLGSILFFDYWVVLICLPFWLLASPLVLLVTNLDRWRFWIYFAVGRCFW